MIKIIYLVGYIIIYLNYNIVMKKFIILCLLFPCIFVSASEITEDYMDIATNYCIYGKYRDAISYIEKILLIEPGNTEAKELKNTLLRITNPNIQSYLSSTNQNLSQAASRKMIGDKNGQLEALKRTNDFWSNYFLAEYYRNNDDFLNSINYYQKAIELKPNYSQSYLGLGKAYADSKNYLKAIDTYNRYISYNKNSDIAYALRADANLNMNYIIEAEDDITKALNIEENISYLLIKAKILYFKGDYDNARQLLQLLSRNIQTAEVYKYIGMCDYAQNDYKNALLNLNKAIILSDDDNQLNSTYNNLKKMLDNQ